MATMVYTQWTVKWSVDFAHFECTHVAFSVHVYSYDPSKKFVMFLPTFSENVLRNLCCFNNLLDILQYTENLCTCMSSF